MLKRKGHYFGTEIDEQWWRRYTKDKFFARGAGEYWYDNTRFNFRRYLTKTPIVLHYQDIIELKTGCWHAGRWSGRRPIVKFIWEKGGLKLSSGFLLSRQTRETEDMLAEFRAFISACR
jgi:hypothetical protein